MCARPAAHVQPQVISAGLGEGDDFILAGVAPHQNWEAFGREITQRLRAVSLHLVTPVATLTQIARLPQGFPHGDDLRLILRQAQIALQLLQVGMVRLESGPAAGDDAGGPFHLGGPIKHALGLFHRRMFRVEWNDQVVPLRCQLFAGRRLSETGVSGGENDQLHLSVRRRLHSGPTVLQAESFLRARPICLLRYLAGEGQQPPCLRAHAFRLTRGRLIRGQGAQLTLQARLRLPDQRGHPAAHACVLVARGGNVAFLGGVEGSDRRAGRICLCELAAEMKLVGRKRGDAVLFVHGDAGCPIARGG